MIDKILEILFECWKFDVDMYRHWWMYAPLCIPAIFYTWFVLLKWAVLTVPIWLPISIIVKSFRRNK